MSMTRREFAEFQKKSGVPLLRICKEFGLNYSTARNWIYNKDSLGSLIPETVEARIRSFDPESVSKKRAVRRTFTGRSSAAAKAVATRTARKTRSSRSVPTLDELLDRAEFLTIELFKTNEAIMSYKTVRLAELEEEISKINNIGVAANNAEEEISGETTKPYANGSSRYRERNSNVSLS